MTGEDLRAMLARSDISQSRMAEDLDVEDRTVRRWVNGETPITKVIEYAIRYYLETMGVR